MIVVWHRMLGRMLSRELNLLILRPFQEKLLLSIDSYELHRESLIHMN